MSVPRETHQEAPGARPGPSPQAIDRLERLLLALYDADGPLTVRQAMDRLADPMSRDDAESAFLRLHGAGQVAAHVGAGRPRRYTTTRLGDLRALDLVGAGRTY